MKELIGIYDETKGTGFRIIEKSSIEISKENGCTQETIRKWLRFYEIPIRPPSPTTERSKCIISQCTYKQFAIKHPREGAILSEETRRKIGESNKKAYLEGRNKGMKGKHHKEETKLLISKIHIESGKSVGEKNPNWQGGIQFIPYPYYFNKRFKQFIRDRDKDICLICNKTRDILKLNTKETIIIHHINFIKLDTYKENCCCLCTSCNFKVNYDREYWKNYLRNKLTKLYGYQYKEENLINCIQQKLI